ncbi:MAG: hypothetical protein LBC18_08370 [Opitutaceae bacterium]|jgi:hypothetical protein|nr:hypothetical protein [Opitutaceae bacterium]
MDFEPPRLPKDQVIDALLLAQKHLREDANELLVRAASVKGALRYLDIAIDALQRPEP